MKKYYGYCVYDSMIKLVECNEDSEFAELIKHNERLSGSSNLSFPISIEYETSYGDNVKVHWYNNKESRDNFVSVLKNVVDKIFNQNTILKETKMDSLIKHKDIDTTNRIYDKICKKFFRGEQ